MKIGIIGSREFPRLDLIKAMLNKTCDEDTIISGGASGVDKQAIDCAKFNGYNFIEYKPDKIESYDVGKYHERNKTIVDNSDILIMFWDKKSPGTLSTLKALIEYLEKPKIGLGQETLL